MEVSFNGTTYPMVLTMGAILDFKRLTGKDVSEVKSDDMEGLVTLCYCCLASACRAKKQEFPYSLQDFFDNCTIDDINAMNEQIARQQAEEEAKKKPDPQVVKKAGNKA
ncbi:MAG: hypothetical protein J5692_00200 [Bacteroidales bacterium]|nr:hypothetical protein [Bacteroidales bacterium]